MNRQLLSFQRPERSILPDLPDHGSLLIVSLSRPMEIYWKRDCLRVRPWGQPVVGKQIFSENISGKRVVLFPGYTVWGAPESKEEPSIVKIQALKVLPSSGGCWNGRGPAFWESSTVLLIDRIVRRGPLRITGQAHRLYLHHLINIDFPIPGKVHPVYPP
jgi:hypothetical protein